MTRDKLLKKICPWGTCDCGDDYESCNCDDCNQVLEEWLDEYDKQIRAKAINDYYNTLNEKINTDTNIKDTIREIHDRVAKEMYCKGIDDLAEKLKACCFMSPPNVRTIERMVEELKESIEND